MKVYTYSQARQQLARLLDEAREEGEVHIRRRDGQTFTIKPTQNKESPLDVPGVSSDVSLEEINQAVRESRERG
jgi:hypothetical protein